MTLSPAERRRSAGGASSAVATPVNLNETFTAENGDTISPEKPVRVTRKLSYVVRRDEKSPNNNSSLNASGIKPKCDLNSTFSYDPDMDKEVQEEGQNSHNISMEDLNMRVATQLRSKYQLHMSLIIFLNTIIITEMISSHLFLMLILFL